MQRLKKMKRLTAIVILLSTMAAVGVAFLRGRPEAGEQDHRTHEEAPSSDAGV